MGPQQCLFSTGSYPSPKLAPAPMSILIPSSAWGISVLKGKLVNFKFFIQTSWSVVNIFASFGILKFVPSHFPLCNGLKTVLSSLKGRVIFQCICAIAIYSGRWKQSTHEFRTRNIGISTELILIVTCSYFIFSCVLFNSLPFRAIHFSLFMSAYSFSFYHHISLNCKTCIAMEGHGKRKKKKKIEKADGMYGRERKSAESLQRSGFRENLKCFDLRLPLSTWYRRSIGGIWLNRPTHTHTQTQLQ